MTLVRLAEALLMTCSLLAASSVAAAERLMVAPLSSPCDGSPADRCLQVKAPLDLDWREQAGGIAGYAHAEGVASLLLVDGPPDGLRLVETITLDRIPAVPSEVLAALAGTGWRLQRADPDDGLGDAWRSHGARLVVEASGGGIGGSTGCNRWNGAWKAEGDAVRIAPLAVTLRACPEPVATLERLYLQRLGETVTVRWWGGEIELVTATGQRLLFDRLLD
ncbi:MAG: META domain-containing protein [Geminicoccaceae bacterium]